MKVKFFTNSSATHLQESINEFLKTIHIVSIHYHTTRESYDVMIVYTEKHF